MDGTTPVTPSSASFAPQPPPPRRKPWIVIGIVVLVIALAAAGVAVVVYTPWGANIRTAWGIMTMPRELRSALFIGIDASGHSKAYRVGTLSYVPFTIPDSMSSIAFDAHHQATIAWQPTYHQLYLDGASFRESTSTLAHVALSPDGAWIGVSMSTTSADAPNPVVPEPITGPNARGWHVVLFATKRDRPQAVIASGSAPAFVGDMLLWLDPRGVVGMKLSDGTRKVLVDATSTAVVSPLEVSADGSLFAVRNLAQHRISVYRLANDSATLVGAVPDTGSAFFALGNQAVYLARVGKNGETQIWEESFQGAARPVLTLPASLHIMRVVLPTS